MKATKDKAKPEFEPFNLNIKVESEEDLRYLWHLFNRSEYKVIRESRDRSCDYPLSLECGDYGTSEIWILLDNELNETD